MNTAISQQLGSPSDRDFSTDLALVVSLPLPERTDDYEDWIHAEMGPQGRWIVRLLRFNRTERTQPWKCKELYAADRDEDSVSLATAYGRAWLFSWATWPPSLEKQEFPLAS